MDDFLRNMLERGDIQPPQACNQLFIERFPGAVNLEWFEVGPNYEVHFHKDEIEHIALFTSEGKLIRFSTQLEKELLPSRIKMNLENDWEIMNSIIINEGNLITYEIIVRNQDLERYLLNVNYLGEIIEKERL